MKLKYTTEKTFHLLPVFSITKHINSLTEQAKKDFNCNWDYVYSIKLGWLFWDVVI